MWQICGHIPQTLISAQDKDVTCMAAKLSVSFFIETFIHAKEKVNLKLCRHLNFEIKFVFILFLLIIFLNLRISL